MTVAEVTVVFGSCPVKAATWKVSGFASAARVATEALTDRSPTVTVPVWDVLNREDALIRKATV
jgi:hypothetical protein